MISIGMDFGSLFTKIAIIDDGIISFLDLNKGNYSRSDIPNSIKYTQNDPANPEIVVDILLDDFQEYFDPCERSFYSEIRSMITHSQNGQPDVVKDFLGSLIKQLQIKYHTFQPSQAKLGLAIPDEWYDTPNHPAPERLIIIFKKLGFHENNIQFQRESICAAANFMYDTLLIRKDLPSQPLLLLICDIGGSKTKFALCEISQNKIYINEKNANHTTSGKAFDEALLHQLTQEQGIEIPLESIKKSYLALIEKGKRDIDDLLTQPIIKIENQSSDRLWQGTLVYTVGQKTLNIKQVWDAFRPIHENINTILKNLSQKCQVDQVLLTGGFSQHPLITTTFKEFFNSEDIVNHKNPIHAISRGAALLTSGQVTLMEPIDYTITTTINTILNGRCINTTKKLISPDNAGVNTEVPLDSPKIVNIKDKDKQEPVVFVKNRSNKETILSIDEQNEHSQWPPPPGEYTLSMKINRHGEIFLLLKSITSDAFYEYTLSE